MKKQYLFLGLVALLLLSTGLVLWQQKSASLFNIHSEKLSFGMRVLSFGEDPNEYVRSQMSICYKNGLNDCYNRAADLFLSQFEYHKVLSVLEATQNYPEVFSRCHEVTHYIGREAYQSYSNIRTLYEQGSPACWGGFYHGVIEAHFDAKPFKSQEEFVAEIRNVCGSLSDYSTPRFFYECIHGIGHAMMFLSSNDLPKSLKWCDSFPDENSRTKCYGGVFMENSSSSTNTSGHRTDYLKADDPMYPCNILDKQYLPLCYEYQSSYFSELVHYDWKKTGDLCLKVPSDYQANCFRTLGSNQVGSTMDTQKMNETCKMMPTEEAKEWCIKGVISGLSGRYINDATKAQEFCGIVKNNAQALCFREFGHALTSWSTDKSSMEHFCEMESEEATHSCLEGLKAPSSPPSISR